MIERLYHSIVALNILICSVHCQDGIKSSLTFVIDSTISMSRDIKSVNESVEQIFDTIVSSNKSGIADFVLVTFNDPGFELRIITNKKEEFKKALDKIHAGGGGDCPEMAMSGIELGLKSSRPFSYLFVFTDARAKDLEKFERVKNLALDINTKINFLLTEYKCPNETYANFTVYETLAYDTGGEFFRLKKNKMSEILKYVKKLTESRKVEIIRKNFKPDEEKKVNVTLDSSIKDVLVSVSGEKPTIHVKDKHNVTVKTTDIADTKKAKIVAMNNTESGDYIFEINCTSNTLLTIHGTTKVTFSYGFSVIKPNYMNETTNRPVADQKSYIFIKLETEGEKINLQRVQVVDSKDNLLLDEPMYIVKEGDQYYISEPIVLPKETFKIVMVAEDDKTKEEIKRISLPIEPQKVLSGTIKNEAPKVTIIGKSKVMSLYGNPLQLTCRVTGYPKPKISWEDDFGSTLTFTVLTLREEYEFVSVLSIDKVNKSNTYTCKASNSIDSDEKSVEVETGEHFDVVNISKDKQVEYNKEEKLFCKVNANPPANVTWYLNGKEIEPDDDLNISLDQSTLIIKKMKPKYIGKVVCEVRNNAKRLVYNMQLSITGVEVPKIDKKITEISVHKGSNAIVSCRILKGNPKPTIQWSFKHEKKDTFYPINEYNEDIHIEKVTSNEVGTYKCIATNEIDKDSHIVDLVIEYAPAILGKNNINIIERLGQTIKIPCEIKGEPAPDIKWFLNGVLIEDKEPYRIHKDNTLTFKVSVEKMGQYSCEGVNKLGSIKKTANLTVFEPVSLDVPEETTITTKVGSKLNISCSAKGYPTPTIQWFFISFDGTKNKFISASAPLIIPVIQASNSGFYICTANNSGGEEKSLAYTIIVEAPPSIKPIERKITAVEGDKVLRMPCESTGEPKPTISWIKNGKPLAIGNEWFSMESDGTLFIKVVKKSMAGMYACAAQNNLGKVYENFEVNIEMYPHKTGKTTEEFLEDNKSAKLQCNVPHTATDEIRWYKNRKVIGHGDLEFRPYKNFAHGYYKCRVSNFIGSTTGTVNVQTGFKPRFTYPEIGNRQYLFDEKGSCLECASSGKPKPKISWWKNKMRIDNNDMTYCYNNKVSSIGEYECVVENKFGKIRQKFNVGADDCLLDIKADFDRYHPLVLSKNYELSNFYVKDGHLAIPIHESAQFFCEGSFNKFTDSVVKATCKESQTFEINRETIDYRKLKCKEALQPVTIKTEEDCALGRGEIFRIGVVVKEFLEVYRICLDKKRKIPLYAEHTLKASAAGVNCIPTESWFNSDVINYNKNEMYDCKKQKVDISAILGRALPGKDDECFVARQLVNEKDVPPGLPQILTHSYLNIIPHWNSDNMKNWDTLEEILRIEIKERNGANLTIRTGISQSLRLPTGSSDDSTDIYIRDKAGNKNIVPVFLWKVITDKYSAASVAIVQVNIPDSLIVDDVKKYEVCANKCNMIDWIKKMNEEYLKSGFMFCCSVYDFEKVFDYYPLFSRGYNKLLRNF